MDEGNSGAAIEDRSFFFRLISLELSRRSALRKEWKRFGRGSGRPVEDYIPVIYKEHYRIASAAGTGEFKDYLEGYEKASKLSLVDLERHLFLRNAMFEKSN